MLTGEARSSGRSSFVPLQEVPVPYNLFGEWTGRDGGYTGRGVSGADELMDRDSGGICGELVTNGLKGCRFLRNCACFLRIYEAWHHICRFNLMHS